MNILTLTDGYKLDHRRQYPSKTTLIYSNWTARGSRLKDINKIVFFWLQYFIKKYLLEEFNNNFFKQPKELVLNKYLRRINNYLGSNQIWTSHLSDLHDLSYLPLEIKALPEWTRVDLKIPMLTIKNTDNRFFWLTNYIETMLSSTLWFPCTSATLAYEFKKNLSYYAEQTSSDPSFIDFQGHDFSMRGMTSIESSMLSWAWHLISFKGTDTLPAIDFLEQYYQGDSDKELIWVSVPATEHSVMSLWWKENEINTFKRVFTEIYPSWIVSIVSDTWDLWKVIWAYLPLLKEDILKREGKVVIRPDSWNPIHILTGFKDFEILEQESSLSKLEEKWVVESLWDIFWWTINDKWFKELNSKIGVIYGDGISLEKSKIILERLKEKWFASTNIVFWIWSYFYQYNTRDTFYFAMKTTYGEIDWKGYEIFKKPITDDWKKHSAKGLLKVEKENWRFVLYDKVSKKEEQEGLLKTVFLNWKLLKDCSLSEIRKNILID